MAPILTRVGQAFGFGASSGGASSPTIVSATGGTKTTVGDYTLHAFTSPGNFVTSADTGGNIQFLMIGGGGSGGNDSGGGGGAGALLVGADVPVGPSQTMAIAIGDGGAGQTGYCNPDLPASDWNFSAPKAGGSDTTFAHPGGTITAYGGSGGGTPRSAPDYAAGPMSPGNSPNCQGGGGGAARSNPEPAGTTPANPPAGNSPPTSGYYTAYPFPTPVGPLITKHIYSGGNAVAPTSQWCGGGGAGGGGNGNNTAPDAGGAGGAGFHAAPLAWFPPTGGVSGYLAGGGGAGGPDGTGDTAGAGGSGGGGGGGGGNPGAGTAGTANTGSGGGGSDQLAAGDGGSGVCYIAYLTPA